MFIDDSQCDIYKRNECLTGYPLNAEYIRKMNGSISVGFMGLLLKLRNFYKLVTMKLLIFKVNAFSNIKSAKRFTEHVIKSQTVVDA